MYHQSKCFLQVWTGNDDCKEETWEECKPYRYPAKFEKDMVNCTDSIKIPYCNNCNQVLKPITTQSVTCKPKSAVQCKPVVRQICQDGKYFSLYSIKFTLNLNLSNFGSASKTY